MSEEFDIYGDDTYGSEIQSDDILGEIVGESTPSRQAKRRKPNPQNPEDDLFEDFGEIDKETKATTTTTTTTATTSSRNEGPSTQSSSTSNNSQTAPKQHTVASSSSPSSSTVTNANTDYGHHHHQHQRQQTPQKIPSSIQAYNRNLSDSPASSTASRRELPVSMSNLRGMVGHPTTGIYIGELAWYVTDEDVKAPLVDGGIAGELKDMTFFEHKVNGKSRGICFLEFNTTESAAKAKDLYDKCEIDGKTPNVSFTTSQNPFKHIPKEPVPKSQRVPQRDSRMNNNTNTSNPGPQMMSGGFNPMMAAGGFNPAFASMGANMGANMGAANMGMNPYGGFNPMAAAAARGGFYDNMMGMPGGGGGRGGRGGMRGGGGQPYMGRMGGRGGAMMGGGMSGNGGMYINPAFFEQQQQGGAGNNA